ncbi:hypothetical protein ACN6KF_003001 [Labrys sp. La1]|uniref:hypothetical protein n=1 Tax=Labrys sp. La1 TaxID=3404917 RepID=UPI003EBDE087
MITEKMIEAGARALYAVQWPGYDLERQSDATKNLYRKCATAALEASERAAWRPIEAATREPNRQWLASSREWQCPAVIQWVEYDAEAAEELGEPGYWAYVESLIGDAAGAADEAELVRPLPSPPEAPKGEE